MEVATRLMAMEKHENLDIQVVFLDMRHRSMTLTIQLREQEVTFQR